MLSAEQANPSAAEVPTLLFLPHCESDFTTTVMRANAAALPSIAVLGACRRTKTPTCTLQLDWQQLLSHGVQITTMYMLNLQRSSCYHPVLMIILCSQATALLPAMSAGAVVDSLIAARTDAPAQWRRLKAAYHCWSSLLQIVGTPSSAHSMTWLCMCFCQ